QICSEGVEITAGPRRFDEVAQLLVPLRVPDLPVVLWCRGPSAFSLRAFDALFPLADKIIFDSSAVPAAGAALGFLRRLRARGYRVSDLDWTRLTGWREILAHLFDNHALRPSGVSSARVIYGGSEASASALYFASWIGNALPDARVRLEAARESEPGLRSVVLIGSKEEIALTKTGGSCIDVKGSGRDYRSPLPPVDEQALMREELKIIGPDPVFERVLG
ncbi:MAG TPA: glucose-6-phosphate dehydrogenase assembly protein OpcA, partial [Bryobacteraceae bacterium]|nr:glucose-6-phosphate dehydrogenase assembly protein OpcA [Bryobacteraceae bacterium]